MFYETIELGSHNPTRNERPLPPCRPTQLPHTMVPDTEYQLPRYRVMTNVAALPRYALNQSYDWNYENAPDPVHLESPTVPGTWKFCGLPVDSPLGIPAGPLLNGRWCLYYASLGFDVLTYKTVRSRPRACYPRPNLQPVDCDKQLTGRESTLLTNTDMTGSWAVSFGMPSKAPDEWRADVERTRTTLPAGKLLSVSVVASVQDGWSLDDLASDYAQCAKWAFESGADCVETNFSCPNVSTCDGQLYQEPNAAAVVAARVRESLSSNTPFIVKIGHIKTRQEAAALLEALSDHVDALAMTNSVATKVETPDGAALFDGERRGICGAAILRASLEQTQMVADLVREGSYDLQLIGVGGAYTARDVSAYLAAGSHAVHLATAAMVHPPIAIEIKKQLTQVLS